MPDFENLRSEIHDILEEEVSENPRSYNEEQPYQEYERIGFEGRRWSVEKRIEEYGLDSFFDPEAKVLDIGSNFGFFVCEFALHCSEAHGVEPNPYLNQIGRLTARYLGCEKDTRFFDSKLGNLQTETTYDTILSLAAFYTQDKQQRGSAEKYFSKVSDHLFPGGHLFYESTSYTKEEGTDAYDHNIARKNALEAIGQQFDIVEEWETPSGTEGFFRQFILARQT